MHLISLNPSLVEMASTPLLVPVSSFVILTLMVIIGVIAVVIVVMECRYLTLEITNITRGYLHSEYYIL